MTYVVSVLDWKSKNDGSIPSLGTQERQQEIHKYERTIFSGGICGWRRPSFFYILSTYIETKEFLSAVLLLLDRTFYLPLFRFCFSFADFDWRGGRAGLMRQIANLLSPQKLRRFESSPRRSYAVCPGGEGADLKSVGCKRLAGSNPVHGVCSSKSKYIWLQHI